MAKTKVIGIRVEDALWTKVQHEATASGVSTAWWVTEAVKERLAQVVVRNAVVVRHEAVVRPNVVRNVVQPKEAGELKTAAEQQLERLRLQQHYREHPEDAPQ